MNLGFQITNDDVNTVMARHGQHLDDIVLDDLLEDIDEDAVERMALKAGTDMNDQTNAALSEIEDQLIAAGHAILPKLF